MVSGAIRGVVMSDLDMLQLKQGALVTQLLTAIPSESPVIKVLQDEGVVIPETPAPANGGLKGNEVPQTLEPQIETSPMTPGQISVLLWEIRQQQKAIDLYNEAIKGGMTPKIAFSTDGNILVFPNM
jgi:hypothetical protein